MKNQANSLGYKTFLIKNEEEYSALINFSINKALELIEEIPDYFIESNKNNKLSSSLIEMLDEINLNKNLELRDSLIKNFFRELNYINSKNWILKFKLKNSDLLKLRKVGKIYKTNDDYLFNWTGDRFGMIVWNKNLFSEIEEIF